MASDNARLIATIGMMDATAAEHDGEAVNAFRAATRMLKAQGLTWAKVAEMALDRPSLRPMATRGSAMDQAFGDVFADIFEGGLGPGFSRPGGFGSPYPPKPTAAPESRKGERLHGVDVPALIRGTVDVIDADRKARTGPMLVLQVTGEMGETYGPLACFSDTIIDDLKRAREGGKEVIARIQPPRIDTHMPVVVSVSVGD